MTNFTKPEKKHHEKPAYGYFDLIHYLEAKYGFDSRDWGARSKDNLYTGVKANKANPHQDFWSGEMCDLVDGNGVYFSLDLSPEQDPYRSDWVNEVYALLRKEFPDETDNVLPLYVWW